MKNSWNNLFGWYNTGDFVEEQLSILKTGNLALQKKALYSIKLEIEHQGGLSYLAPFAIKELIQLIEINQLLVKNDLIQYFKELVNIINEYLNYFEDTNLYNQKKKLSSLDKLLTFINQHPDQEGEFSLWETENEEGLLMVHIISKKLIEEYLNKNK